MVKLDKLGIDLLKKFEGSRNKVYRDSAGLKTIGVGHLVRENEHFEVLTDDQVEELLHRDLERFYKVVDSLPGSLNQDQINALVCLAFNIGVGAFKRSTVRKKLIKKDFKGAGDAFLMWRRAGGRVSTGLVIRRAVEATIFMGGKSQKVRKAIQTLSSSHQKRAYKLCGDYLKRSGREEEKT